MSQLFESIKVSRQRIHHFAFHNSRINHSRKVLFDADDKLNILDYVSPQNLSNLDFNTTYKCRILYREQFEKLEFHPYQIKSIRSLKMIEAEGIEYAHKFAERSNLQNLFSQKEDADDVLIIKNGFVTDTSYGSPVFWDGHQWYCSATPLLPSTQCAFYQLSNQLKSTPIRPQDLKKYTHFKVINAMRSMEDIPPNPIDNIIP